MNKNEKLEKLEALADKKRKSIENKRAAIKREEENLKHTVAEIERLKGEQFRKDINSLNLTREEFERFRKQVLSNRENLLDVISMMEELSGKSHIQGQTQSQKQEETEQQGGEAMV